MIYTNSDGGSRGNPGPAAIGVIVRRDEEIITQYTEKIDDCTNNVAEYKALVKALEMASQFTKDEVTCVLDSELLVKQLLGEYSIKSKNLLPLFLKVQKLQENFNKIKYVHVPRWDRFQKVVDKLLNLELDNK
ncbi:MAG TPA: ribonuclease HI family protein [Candidatus Omnitrophota bacterium]|nr:ribonuclease HI family protein [Candidatus Omnitrophota bacterium]